MQTQSSILGSGESIQAYRAGAVGTRRSTTGLDQTRARRGIFRPAPSADTGAELLDADASPLQATALQATAKAPVAKQVRQNVDGVVSAYDDVSVTCLLHLRDKEVRAQLPRALFPTELRYGLPVSIEMTDSGGIRRPVVRVREIDSEAAKKVADEFDAILAELS